MEFPIFDYEVESDTDAVGLYSAAICNSKDLILLELDFTEWQDAQSGKLHRIPSRYSQDTPDDMYRFAHVLRIEPPPLPPAGLKFSEFRQKYQAPTVIYSCPCCSKGEAVSVHEVASSEFLEAGGHITTLGQITLCGK